MSEAVILVPLDGSEPALAALPVANVLGEIGQTPLHILHVGDPEPAVEGIRSHLGHEASMPDGVVIKTRPGVPSTEILRAAEEIKSRLIVLCKQSADDRGEMLGHTAMKVLHDASCPVVLVPPERGLTPWRLHHILVPHDGTPTTSAALQPAAELAELAHAELQVVHIITVGVGSAEPGSLPAPRYIDQPQHEWPAWTNEFVKRLASVCQLGLARVRINVAQGDPAAEILRISEQQATDLIVLAWRGRWEIPHAATLKGILREAHCPIMVARA
jgi:nucleotide-binding universal stress UspA family protein